MPSVLFLAASMEPMNELIAALAPADPIEILGTRKSPFAARDDILSRRTDVVVIDVDGLGREGVDFLRKVMHHRPLPVLIIMSMDRGRDDIAAESLVLGALDVLAKGAEKKHGSLGMGLKKKILELSSNRRRAPRPKKFMAPDAVRRQKMRRDNAKPEVVGIAASTGGPAALKRLLVSLPPRFPPMIIAQSIPPRMIESFARKLASITSLRVKVAREGERLLRGSSYIAPSDSCAVVVRHGDGHVVRLSKKSGVNARPADEMLRSIAKAAQSRAVGIILSGLGSDGAEGLWAMRQKGALTVAQDESSSMCHELPRNAIAQGGAEYVADLEGIAELLLGLGSVE